MNVATDHVERCRLWASITIGLDIAKTVPPSSNPTMLQLFLPKSIPTTAICICLLPPNQWTEDSEEVSEIGGCGAECRVEATCERGAPYV
jgi:hypothetical protein